ncbi:sulfatase family protein [Ruania alba]|uniref:Arylsulfatase A n=1 Tax=Ruania alba TaxID=648782 RepID=A0A1H5B6V0_9MICO|nr:sulfatase [Ruania alba]SED49680.1 Arylsulfatase A [Ruania alba]
MNRPNILLAIADDASHVSAQGHPFVHTPAFDWVAEHGVLCHNAYTTNPKCAPSRASILTGMHTWQLKEAGNHNGIFPAEFARYPDLLEGTGYHVGYTGKGWAPGNWARQGLTRNPAGTPYNNHRLTPPERTGISEIDYAANFAVFLNDRNERQPFCFWYGGFEPHRRYEPGEGARAGLDPAAVQVPPYLPDVPQVREDLLDYAYEIEWFDRHLGLMIDQLAQAGELENTLIVVTSDNGMPFPRVKGQMLDPDARLPFAVCWPGTVPSGRVIEDLISFVDLAPTFLDAAGITEHPPQMVGRTLMDVLRSEESGQVDPDRDRVFFGRERHDLGYEGDRSYPVRCIRRGDYLYVWNLRPSMWPAGNPETGFTNVDSSPTKETILAQHEAGEDTYYDLAFGKRPEHELYHLPSDPHCIDNLADHPEHKSLVSELEDVLRAELVATGDPRMTGGGAEFDTYEYAGALHHSWAAWEAGTWRPQSY